MSLENEHRLRFRDAMAVLVQQSISSPRMGLRVAVESQLPQSVQLQIRHPL